MKFRFLRWSLGILLVITALVFLVWGLWPAQQASRQIILPGSLFAPIGGSASARTLLVSWPAWMQIGSEADIRLQFQADETAVSTAAVSPDSASPDWHIEARLDMNGAEIAPAGAVQHLISPGSLLPFSWRVRPGQEGRNQGTIWLHLVNTRATGDQDATRNLLTVQPIGIKASSLIGLNAYSAQVLGAIGLVIGLAFSAELVIVLIRKRRDRENN